jgi:CelD/BcsL family acetyltransferase involved in cellulose biosynthesis
MTSTSQLELAVEPLPELPSPNGDWQRLGLEAGNPFSTWEWASAWWRHFGADRPQRILGCRNDSGDLVGILPLYLASGRPLRILRFVGHGPANQLGPICLAQHQTAVARAFRNALADELGWDVCIAERLDASHGWPGVIGGVVTRVESSPIIRFDTSDWDEYLASRSANFRQQTRRMERRLERDHSLRYRLASDPDRLEQDMDMFFALHEERWESAEGSVAFAGKLNQFHRDLAALALAGGWLRLCFLELDGVARAANYSFSLGGAYWYFQAGRDPAFDKDRVGVVLLNNVMREAVQSGSREFKLLLGTHGYKSRYATDDAPVETVAVARNPATRAALRMAVPSRRALRTVRQRLRKSPGHSD